MKIDIPFEIGDPILVIEYNQHDGYYINPKLYELSQEQKRHIQNEYAQVREPTLVWTLDDVKSVEIV